MKRAFQLLSIMRSHPNLYEPPSQCSKLHLFASFYLILVSENQAMDTNERTPKGLRNQKGPFWRSFHFYEDGTFRSTFAIGIPIHSAASLLKYLLDLYSLLCRSFIRSNNGFLQSFSRRMLKCLHRNILLCNIQVAWSAVIPSSCTS